MDGRTAGWAAGGWMWMDGCIGWECEGPKRGRRRGRRRCAKHQTFREHRWQLNRVSMFRAFPQLELESDRQSEGREPGFTWRPPGLSHSIHVHHVPINFALRVRLFTGICNPFFIAWPYFLSIFNQLKSCPLCAPPREQQQHTKCSFLAAVGRCYKHRQKSLKQIPILWRAQRQ